jgi:hypothetical protein
MSGAHHSIDVTPLTHLRSIRFMLGSANHNPWVTQILTQISSGHLEEVVFHLAGLAFRFGPGISGALEWREVDTILQRATFSRLKNVKFRGRPRSEPVMEYLPRCHARGILS